MHDHGADYTILWRFHVVGMHLPHPLCSPWPSYCLVGSLPLLFVGITPLGKALCSIFAVTFSWGKIPLQRGGAYQGNDDGLTLVVAGCGYATSVSSVLTMDPCPF